MQYIDGVPVWGTPDPNAVKQIVEAVKAAPPGAVAGAALMADHHVGYSVPIGGVIAYRGYVSPSGVGYDIACGNEAVRLDLPGSLFRDNIRQVMDEIWHTLSFGIGRKNTETVEWSGFNSPAWDAIEEIADLKGKAGDQLGTIGSGNHFVDIFVDEEDRPWVGVHFGSRGFGWNVASRFIRLGGGKDGMFVAPVLLKVESELGWKYVDAMQLAGAYAYAGRDWVCQKVASLFGGKIVETVHNNHNFAWLEQSEGEDVWVVRKGATPARVGQRGFVGGSMGDVSVIIEGLDHPNAGVRFSSTVHGAGRVMSRTQAAGRKRGRFGKREGGSVTQAMMDEWVQAYGVELRGGGTDESPHVYKRLPEVLAEHAGQIKVVHTLRPLGVAMAGPDEHDPYKD